MHYGSEFRIEVVDASTDTSVGTALLSTQGLLQWQRDDSASESNIFFSLEPPKPMEVKKRSCIFELRTGVKRGFGLDFYNSGKVGSGPRRGMSALQLLMATI